MITQVEIVNFRGIKHLELGLKQISIIAGKNDIGKSTALNAVNWLITNKLLTDKYGDGENDIQSIIPNDHRKGEHTEVSIWLDSGTKFSKVLKRGYERNSNKINKHETEYKINDAKVPTQKDFYFMLYEQLGFNPKFTRLKVDEVRLFTDPLYALLKLDYKELRNLLVAMGCTVSNEELYQLGFEDLRQYESKFIGKWDVMRKSLKTKSSSLDEDIKKYESQLQLFNGVGEFDPSILKQLQDDKEVLIQNKNDIKNKGIKDLVSEFENQKTRLVLELEEKRNNRKLEYNSKIKELELEQKNIVDNFNNEKAAATKNVNEMILNKSKAKVDLKSTLAELKLKAGVLDMDIKLLDVKIKNTTETLNKASEELGKIINGNNEDFVCPVCGSPIDIHAEEHEFLMNELTGKIMNYESELEEFGKSKEEKQSELNRLNTEIKSNEELEKQEEEEIQTLYRSKLQIENEFVLDKKADELKTKIFELQEKVRNINLEFEEENKAINEIDEKIRNTLIENSKTVNEELGKIAAEIEVKDQLIRDEFTKQNDCERKHELQESLDLTIKEFNDNESLLARLNQFIKKMCELINSKAKAITGFNFVLLEENLSNDGISEVCYIVDSAGVPFKDINTARKTIMGIEFIESCRRIAGNNSLPILADRLEGLDTNNLNKLKEITTNQIICTRVTDGELTVESV